MAAKKAKAKMQHSPNEALALFAQGCTHNSTPNSIYAGDLMETEFEELWNKQVKRGYESIELNFLSMHSA